MNKLTKIVLSFLVDVKTAFLIDRKRPDSFQERHPIAQRHPNRIWASLFKWARLTLIVFIIILLFDNWLAMSIVLALYLLPSLHRYIWYALYRWKGPYTAIPLLIFCYIALNVIRKLTKLFSSERSSRYHNADILTGIIIRPERLSILISNLCL